MANMPIIDSPELFRRYCEFSTLADVDLCPLRVPDTLDRTVCEKLRQFPGGNAALGRLLMQEFQLKPVSVIDTLQPQHLVALEPYERLKRILDLTAKSVMKPQFAKAIQRSERLRIREFVGAADSAFLASAVPLLVSQSKLEMLSRVLVQEATTDIEACYRATVSAVVNALWGRESRSFQQRVELKLDPGIRVLADTVTDTAQSQSLATLAVRIRAQSDVEGQ